MTQICVSRICSEGRMKCDFRWRLSLAELKEDGRGLLSLPLSGSMNLSVSPSTTRAKGNTISPVGGFPLASFLVPSYHLSLHCGFQPSNTPLFCMCHLVWPNSSSWYLEPTFPQYTPVAHLVQSSPTAMSQFYSRSNSSSLCLQNKSLRPLSVPYPLQAPVSRSKAMWPCLKFHKLTSAFIPFVYPATFSAGARVHMLFYFTG